VACLRTQVDITEGIPKQVTIQFCRFCERYLQPPQQWISAALESRELMAICLKKLKGLARVKLIDASFLWTEPHSKRLKIKLQIQAEVLGGAILQQTFVVEYTVAYQMCPDCHRTEAKDHWNCLVQVRQKTKQRKTLFFLEQLLIKYNATKDCVGIKPNHEGLDFFFATESKVCFDKKTAKYFTSRCKIFMELNAFSFVYWRTYFYQCPHFSYYNDGRLSKIGWIYQPSGEGGAR